MKAMGVRQFGGVASLECLKMPEPRPGHKEVVVAIDAASVDPADWKVASGTHARLTGVHSLPFVPGWGVAGAVVDKGGGVRDHEEGDFVVARLALERQGAYAERVAIPSEHLARLPEGLDAVRAAALPVAGVTAWQSLHDHGQLRPGQRVLVTGGAGGVGHFAVQLAVAAGASVIATASAGNAQFLQQLGCDGTIDYQTQHLSDVLGDNKVDLAIDCVGDDVTSSCIDVVRPGGRMISPAGFPDVQAYAARSIMAMRMSTKPDPVALERMVAMTVTGDLRPHIQQVYDLTAAPDAWKASMGGHVRGKLVLRVGGTDNE